MILFLQPKCFAVYGEFQIIQSVLPEIKIKIEVRNFFFFCFRLKEHHRCLLLMNFIKFTIHATKKTLRLTWIAIASEHAHKIMFQMLQSSSHFYSTIAMKFILGKKFTSNFFDYHSTATPQIVYHIFRSLRRKILLSWERKAISIFGCEIPSGDIVYVYFKDLLSFSPIFSRETPWKFSKRNENCDNIKTDNWDLLGWFKVQTAF